MMTLVPRSWHATPRELEDNYPCDSYLPHPFTGYVRAIDIAAPSNVVFRWLCQLKSGAYSYPALAGKGETSPETLTPGMEKLAVGQGFLVFSIVDFQPGEHISGVIRDDLRRWYGPVAVTYRVVRQGENASRLVVRVNASGTGLYGRLRREVLALGDMIMMRKQLMNIKRLAERDAQKSL